MARPTPDLTRATMRACCDLIVMHGSLSIADLVEKGAIGDPLARRSVALGMKLGYLVEGPKPARLGKGNRKKTYLRTKKRLPVEQLVPALSIEEEIIDMKALKPRRDWGIEALFGPYEARV